ncbi:SAM-dependent methyltransferase [Bythopirellula goksoeyrii]|uniref:Cyclopropane-fatty-acyl-phospholipid synthase n=1 Tax=Bythopirellula goksoeyrii TaxID=1400387 RepID=A0A5B9QD28_9BACT|nr:cyclopropane-fatty-acyl-phospholipid synthase family protein [Bythopirellula goksoeyrii]QEG36858.1 Cyclopropane-fatty-acyl-phospholipid synthase [Bythopirellula goksoeyrii]
MSVLSSPKQTRNSNKQHRRVDSQLASANRFGLQQRLTVLDRWYRAALVHRLNRIETGKLILVDSTGSICLNQNESSSFVGEIHVLDPRFYRQAVLGGGVGAAEAFIRGFWESPDLLQLMRVMARNRHVLTGLEDGFVRLVKPLQRIGHWARRNTLQGSRQNIADHYDLSNEFFATFLDSTMSYSAGIFEHPKATLEDASIAKFKRLCQLLKLTADDHLLEIGTGWGGLAICAAREYGCRVTTTTISQTQYEYVLRKVNESGLADRIRVLRQDYRELQGQYDKLVSVEMIEAVGHEFLNVFFTKCASLLRPGGRFALQAITIPEEREKNYLRSVDFIQKYVFPGGSLPSTNSIKRAVAVSTDLQLEAIDEFGAHYGETLARWHRQFVANLNAYRVMGMSERFIRTWRYYFSYCEAGFREEMIELKQILFVRPKD